MAHFVKLNDDNVVIDAIVLNNENAPDPAPANSEPLGRHYISSLAALDSRLEGRWVQTSYNRNFRKNYAGIGFTYDEVADVFIKPQPYPSWSLDANHDWQPPTPMPAEGGPWAWDEDTLSWVEVAA